jgi:hypothetical protein
MRRLIQVDRYGIGFSARHGHVRIPITVRVVERKDSHLTLTDSAELSVIAPPFSLLHPVLE